MKKAKNYLQVWEYVKSCQSVTDKRVKFGRFADGTIISFIDIFGEIDEIYLKF